MGFWVRMGSSMACRTSCSACSECREVGPRLSEKKGTLDLGGKIVATECVGERALLQFWQHG